MLDPDRDVQERLKALGRPGSSWPVDGRDRILTEVRRRQRRRAAASGAMAAGSVAAVIGGVFVTGASVPRTIEAPVATTTTTTTAPTPSGTPPLDELTGKAVGLALGLSPDLEGDDVGKCSGLYAEYAENGAGFCLAGVTDDLVREMVLARQINGYAPTDTVKAYAAAWVELKNYHGPPGEKMLLMHKLGRLAEEMEAQGRAE